MLKQLPSKSSHGSTIKTDWLKISFNLIASLFEVWLRDVQLLQSQLVYVCVLQCLMEDYNKRNDYVDLYLSLYCFVALLAYHRTL